MRDLTINFSAELSKRAVRPAVIYEGIFDDLAVRLWSGTGDLIWDGKTFRGNGWLQGISTLTETAEIRADGMVVTLSAIPTEVASLILSNNRQGDPGRLWLAFFDDSPEWNLVSDPYPMFDGKLDVPEVEFGADSSTVSIAYEHRLIDLQRPRIRRYTDQDQKAFYPEDKGFEYMSFLQTWSGFWGKQSNG